MGNRAAAAAEAIDILREPYERFAGQRPSPWDPAFDGSPFESLRREDFTEELTVDTETLLAMYSTTSSLAAIAADEREALFARVRPLLRDSHRLPVAHELTWTRLRA